MRRALVGTARVELEGERMPDRLEDVLDGLPPERELVVPVVLPEVGRELEDEREDVLEEDDRDFDDFDGALATAVL